MKPKTNKFKYLDDKEKELIESFNEVNLNSINKPTDKQQAEYKKSAEEFIKKETKMNIRIDPLELKKIKKFAEKEGLKYQTFIKSIVHKYMTGRLVEKK